MFTLAGRVYGSMVVNRLRLVLALVFLIAAQALVYGTFLPTGAGWQAWLWMGLSGFVGLVLGDLFLFQAFVWIGPRLTMLMMSLAPVIGAVSAWLFLGEKLEAVQILGIAVTLLGIGWVVWEGNNPVNGNHLRRNPNYGRGILFGLGAAAGQALGLVLSKKGMGADLPAISGNVMRMLVATCSLWVITLFQRQAGYTLGQLRRTPRSVRYIVIGALFGPFVGVSFSLYAVQHADVGVASTLMALTPVVLLPVSYIVFKERYGWGAVLGTLVAIVGVAILFLA
jgi:drug/metabolite transporter (DMT)-like permease